jgi:hypothetical protein
VAGTLEGDGHIGSTVLESFTDGRSLPIERPKG